jgi:hypothetical protein
MGGPTKREHIAAAEAAIRIGDQPDPILPEGWTHDQLKDPGPSWKAMPEKDTMDGRWWVSTDKLKVLVSVGQELDGKFWLHVSFSRKDRLPSWFDIKRVKDAFIGETKTAYQVLPPKSHYVNIRETVLHLWHCLDGDVTPDFTRGTGSI